MLFFEIHNLLILEKRTDNALKVKSFEDSECEVLGYKEKAKGSLKNQTGSIKCKLEDGKIFLYRKVDLVKLKE